MRAVPLLLLASVATTQAYYSGRITEDGTLSKQARKSKVEGIPGRKYWADTILEKGYVKAHAEGEAPYRPPTDWVYNTSSKPVEGKINVHLVPHTHDDTGWQVTVDQYFFSDVYYVLDTVIPRLAEDINRKFIYVEIGFFARWWDQQPEVKKDLTRKLVKNKQLEFINGGWCMHDEASPYYTAMVDQTTRGHMFLKKNFGDDAIPKATWQIDPFGHSNTQAWLLGAEAGMESMFWGRTDYQDLNYRKQARNHTDDRWPEWVWQGSASLGKSAEIFAGELGGGGYGTYINFNDAGNDKMSYVQDDPSRHDYNVDAWVDKMIAYAQDQASFTKSSQQMWPCGSDFEYQNADHWYHNLDKLIHYLNKNGTVNFMYSTPTIYVAAKHAETLKKDMKWEVRSDDIFPLADNSHNYWSGYFTSRPALKRQVRLATNFLTSARQLEVIAKPTKMIPPTARPAPPVGTSFTDSLEGTIGVATHHDGMSGTSRQDVADDYEQRISESHIEAETGVSDSLAKLMGSDMVLHHCNCNNGVAGGVANDCLNISMCEYTAGRTAFQVVAWNPQGHSSKQLIRVPVTGNGYTVTSLANTSRKIDAQLIPLTKRDYELPLLYLTYNELANDTIVKRTENKATHVLTFLAELPPVGYETFEIKLAAPSAPLAVPHHTAIAAQAGTRYSNGYYEIEISATTGMVEQLHNIAANKSTPFSIDWGWYNASVGGCTKGVSAGMEACSNQESGAYMFRPNSSNVFTTGPSDTVITKVVEGELVTEIQQTFSDWATHVIRLVKGSPVIEVEWTAGPIPINQPWLVPPAEEKKLCGPNGCMWGKEVVIMYQSGIASKETFYTDSNGREMLKRVKNKRGPSYPPLNVSEPVAGNYYPVNAMISLNDDEMELTVLTDVSMGGSSMRNGGLELMVHRRLQHDDSRGVQEPLNETMCGCGDIGATPGQMGEHGHEGDGGCECAGLTMRGKHWLIFDKIETAHMNRRLQTENLQYPATLAFNIEATKPTRPAFTAISKAFPANVKLMTLTNNYKEIFDGGLMLRLAHTFAVDEHPTLSKPVNISLAEIFAKDGLKLKTVLEVALTGNQPLADMDAQKMKWPTHDPTHGNMWHTSENVEDTRVFMDTADASFTVTLRPMELRTLIVTFEDAEFA